MQALHELLDDPDRNDWDEFVAASRALIKAIETGEPMTRRNARIVAEYLREARWSEGAIGAVAAQTNTHAGEGLITIDTSVDYGIFGGTVRLRTMRSKLCL